jgi:hypothetical protein
MACILRLTHPSSWGPLCGIEEVAVKYPRSESQRACKRHLQLNVTLRLNSLVVFSGFERAASGNTL